MTSNLRESAEQIIESADYNQIKTGIVSEIRRLAFKFGPENIPELDKEQLAKSLGEFEGDIVEAIAMVLMEEE